jgi:chemotaxis protein MotA
MNLFTVVAFAIAGLVFGVSVFTSTDNPMALVDVHGILIVLGGSVAATAISFQLDRVLAMLKVFWIRTVRNKKPDYVKIIRDLMRIAEAYRNDAPNLPEIVKQTADPFCRESMQVLLDQIVDDKRMIKILRNRVETIYQRYLEDANRFRATGKFPPAMGLMGAVLGMIALLGSLGSPGAEKNIGPAMSVALVATFYGIALANLVVIPIGENLTECAKEIRTKNTIIVEGVRLIAERTNPIVLAEELNSFLLPGERIDWKKIES